MSVFPLLAVVVHEIRARPFDRMRRRDIESMYCLPYGLFARRVARPDLEHIGVAHTGSAVLRQGAHH